jgi:hypothetical protein
MRVWEDLLITTVEPQIFDDQPLGSENWNATASNRLLVMDRHSGKVLWSRQARIGFRHNTIIVDNGRVFLIDGQSASAMELLERRGLTPAASPAIHALDAASGRELWTQDQDVFGTWLSYSRDYDLLIQAGRRGGKRDLPDEPNDRMSAHRAADGSVLWNRSSRYAGPLALHGRTIYPGKPGAAVDLLTGQEATRLHPLTHEEQPWTYARAYGCGTQLTSTHLMTFRSGAAGFVDLTADAGTANLGGFKAGCTNNLVVAGGVVTAFDYTRTCTCAYQHQTSLAFIHMPDVELWTSTAIDAGTQPLRRIGLNLAAPGNRMSETGTLWLNWPSVGGPSPKINIKFTPKQPKPFRWHSSQVAGDDATLAWVSASGLEGLQKISVRLMPETENSEQGQPTVTSAAGRSYTIRLHFMEPVATQAGQRIFDVLLQDQQVLTGLDILAKAGGRMKGLMKEFIGVQAGEELTIELRPAGESSLPPVLCGIEAEAE